MIKNKAVNDEQRSLAEEEACWLFLPEAWTYKAGVLEISSTGDKQRRTKQRSKKEHSQIKAWSK